MSNHFSIGGVLNDVVNQLENGKGRLLYWTTWSRPNLCLILISPTNYVILINAQGGTKKATVYNGHTFNIRHAYTKTDQASPIKIFDLDTDSAETLTRDIYLTIGWVLAQPTLPIEAPGTAVLRRQTSV